MFALLARKCHAIVPKCQGLSSKISVLPLSVTKLTLSEPAIRATYHQTANGSLQHEPKSCVTSAYPWPLSPWAPNVPRVLWIFCIPGPLHFKFNIFWISTSFWFWKQSLSLSNLLLRVQQILLPWIFCCLQGFLRWNSMFWSNSIY